MADNTAEQTFLNMNDEIVKVDGSIKKLAESVDALSNSYSALAQSGDMQKFIGSIKDALAGIDQKFLESNGNVHKRVSNIINDLTNFAETAKSLGRDFSEGISIDFIKGENLSQKQQEFNKEIIRMSNDFENARDKVLELRNGLIDLYVQSNKRSRRGSDFKDKVREILDEMKAQEEIMRQNAAAYEAVERNRSAIDKANNAAKQEEEQIARQLISYYTELGSVKDKVSGVQTSNMVKDLRGMLTQDDVSLLELYNDKEAELLRKINEITAKYPELAAEIKNTFQAEQLERDIKNRDRQTDAIERTNKALEKEAENLEKRNKKEKEKEISGSPKAALDYSKQVSSVNEAKNAINYLTQARDNLNNKDQNYKQTLDQLNDAIRENQEYINSATGATKKLSQQNSSLLDSINRVSSAFGVMFSLYGVANFIKGLVRVTGEFELQQVALASIIKDAHKANEMFNEIQQMAVASPYSVSQLVSYNKQLAAYRIETEKLLPTLKQLGDIASGVGVDMQRLILAYGQVKAANYLRGQELRQFSEAGINILGELARRFSEAEGKIVSTGEVFDRVSKRMVRFEDVAAVFDDLTKQGGIFYDMQSKQAKTVRGQIVNLKDAFQIAMYDIGKSNDQAINAALKGARVLISNLKTIVSVGTAGLAIFAGYKLELANINALIKKTKDVITSIDFKSLGISTLITSITAIVAHIIQVNKELREIRRDGIETINTLGDAFDHLLESLQNVGNFSIKDNTFSTENLETSLKFIQDYIDDLSKEGIDMMPFFKFDADEGDVEEMAGKMSEFIANAEQRAQELAEAKRKGEEMYVKSFILSSNNTKSIVKNIEDSTKRIQDNILAFSIGLSMEIENSARKGIITYKEAEEAAENLNKARNKEYTSLSELDSLLQSVRKTQLKIEKSTGKQMEYAKGLVNTIAMLRSFGNFEEGTNYLTGTSEYFLAKFMKELGHTKEEMDDIFSSADPTKAMAFVNEYLQFVKSAFEKGGGAFTDELWNEFVEQLMRSQDINPIIANVILKVKKTDVQEELSGWRKTYNDEVEKINKKYGTNIQQIIRSDEKRIDILKRLKTQYDETTSAIKDYNRATSAKIKSDWDEGTIESMKNLQEALKIAGGLLGGWDEKNKGGAGKDLSGEFENLVRFIRQLNKEYKELNKTFASEEAAKRVMQSFKKEFAALPAEFQKIFGDNIGNIEFMTPEQVISSLNKIEPLIDTKYKKWADKLQISFGKALGEVQTKIDVDFKQGTDKKLNDEIEKMFSDYQISIELQKLGISKDDARDIFNLDAVDLSDLAKRIEAMRAEVSGTDEEKKYEEFQKKLTDIYEKAQMERLKSYSKFLQDEMSERVKIEMETLEKLARLEATQGLDETHKNRIRKKILEDSNKRLDQQTWKDFQQSDLYVSVFTDIQNASSQALGIMKQRLEDLGESLKGLSATELRALAKQLDQIRDKMVKDNPFDALIVSIKDFEDAKKDILSDEGLKGILGVDEFGNIRKTIRQGLQEISNQLNGFYKTADDGSEHFVNGLLEQQRQLEKLYQSARRRDVAGSELGMKGVSVNNIKEAESWLKSYQKSLEYVQAQLSQKDIAGNEKTNLTNLSIEYQEIIDLLAKYIGAMDELGEHSTESTRQLGTDLDNARTKTKELEAAQRKLLNAQGILTQRQKAFVASLQKTSETVDKVQSMFETWMDNIDYLGGETDELTEAQKELGSAIMGSFRQILSLMSNIIETIPTIVTGFTTAGLAINAAMGIIGLIAEAIQLVITLISAIAKYNDDLKQAEIDRIQKSVDRLAKSYERLAKAMDEAYDGEKLRTFNREIMYNLGLQKDYIEEQIALEKSKKKSDKEALKQWEDDLDDINDKMIETSEKLYEELGGFGSEANYKDAAQQFIDAWYDAYMETGNGLSGLEDTFDEFFKNMMKKQLMQKLADTYLTPLLNEFDTILNKGDVWEEQDFWDDYTTRLHDRLAEANAAFTEYFSRLGDTLGVGAGMEGLQQGISGITESTAEILAAYLNSIRLYIAEDSVNLGALVGTLGAGSSNDSILTNMRIVAQNTNAISQLLDSVTRDGHPMGGSGIKVFAM